MFRRRTKNAMTISAVTGLLVGGAALAAGADESDRLPPVPGEGAHARLHDRDGDVVGSVRMTQTVDEKVMVRARVHDIEPAGDFHGFHIHQTGECDPPFDSAGGHYNPDSADHGQHAGDLPVLAVNEDGTARARFTTDRFTVAELFDDDGSAVIVHEGRDNYANIPARYHSEQADEPGPDQDTLSAGDAGDRFACGVVTRQ